MNYQDTLDYMYSRLPMFQRIGKAAYKANLDNTIALLKALGNPETKFKSVHIAGTNGKGSTSHMMASVFQEAGYKVGLYTSPHLTDFRERIKINGLMIPKNEVVDFIKKTKETIHKIEPSFFELTMAMAFQYFAVERVDIAIIETGLGGRLDSTNIIQPEISVITNIGLDHMQFLGEDIESIAKEKGGIIKKTTPVIIGQSIPVTRSIFDSISASKDAPIIYAEDEIVELLPSDLKGNYQVYNIRTAINSIRILVQLGWKIPDSAVQKGLNKVKENTGLHGRWDILGEEPKIICDTGHNEDGLKEIMRQLKSEKYNRLHIVLGMVNDKEISSLLTLFPKEATYYFCRASVPRSLDVIKLHQLAIEAGLNGTSYGNVKDAFQSAKENSQKNDLIFIGGSTFVVADFLTFMEITRPQ